MLFRLKTQQQNSLTLLISLIYRSLPPNSKSSFRYETDPLQSHATFQPPGRYRNCLPRVFNTLQRHLSNKPRKEKVVYSFSGSTHRLSQPLSGFLASLKFVALFHATTIPGSYSFRVFPLQKLRISCETTCSLTVIHYQPSEAQWTLLLTVSRTIPWQLWLLF